MPRSVVISDESIVNSHGFRVMTDGIDISQYERNSLLLFMHYRPFRGTKDEILAIGTVSNLRKENGKLIGDLNFDEKDEFAKKIALKWDDGIYKMVSPGLEPVETSDDPQYLLQGQRYFTLIKSKLEEISVVDIGSNDNALALYQGGKLITLSNQSDLNNLIPAITEKETNSFNNMKQILITLGLPETGTEADAIEKIKALQGEAAKVITLSKTIEEQEAAGITTEVEAAIQLKKITADKKDHFVALGKKIGLVELKSTFSAMQVASKPTDFVPAGGGQGGGESATDTTNKKYNELSETQRINLRKENRPEYIRLFKAEYGFEPEIKD